MFSSSDYFPFVVNAVRQSFLKLRIDLHWAHAAGGMAKVPDHSEQPLQKMFSLLLFKCLPTVPIVLLHLWNSICKINNSMLSKFNFVAFEGRHTKMIFSKSPLNSLDAPIFLNTFLFRGQSWKKYPLQQPRWAHIPEASGHIFQKQVGWWNWLGLDLFWAVQKLSFKL